MNIKITLTAALLATSPAMTWASVSSNQVVSAHIREADGTSGQDTNSGAGVKTGHIQDGAVTARKMGIPNVVIVTNTGNAVANGGALVQALDSISGASQANPYVVKVMPGVYDLGTSSLVMKPYVVLVGSGREATTITSSVDDASQSCATGTVVMADQSAISDAQIINTGWQVNDENPMAMVAALAFVDANARAENVHVVAGKLAGPGAGYIETVCAGGTSATIRINNALIEGFNSVKDGGNCDVFHDYSQRADFALTNSTGYVEQADPMTNVQLTNSSNGVTAIAIVNSRMEGRGSSQILFAQGGNLDFANSTFIASGAPCGLTGDAATIVNTRFVCDMTGAGYWTTPATTRIANSQISGERSGLAGATLVGNYDENFAPIQNTLPVVP